MKKTQRNLLLMGILILILLSITMAAIKISEFLRSSGISKSFTDLFTLKDKMEKEFGLSDIRVIIQNNTTIGISLINSPFNELKRGAKIEQARKIKTFVAKNYESIKDIDMIWVSFVVHKKYFFIVNFTNSLDTFFFNLNRNNNQWEMQEIPAVDLKQFLPGSSR